MDSPARFKVVTCGRRWGKTELGKKPDSHKSAAAQQTLLVAGANPTGGWRVKSGAT